MKKRNKRPYAHLFKTNPKEYKKLASREWRDKHPNYYAVKQEWRSEVYKNNTFDELPDDVIPIADFPTYYARPNGEIWRDQRNEELAIKRGKARVFRLTATYTAKNGYWIVQPYKDGKRKAVYLHRLMLTAFKGPAPEPNMECHHKDHDTSNNAISNLMWVTRQENVDFVPKHHRFGPKLKYDEGRKKHNSKHFPMYPTILKMWAEGVKRRDIASSLNIDYGVICQIISAHKKRGEL